MIVNPIYVTTKKSYPLINDGKTRLYLSIPKDCDLTKLAIPLYWNQSVSEGVTVNWGDGSEPITVSGTGNVNAAAHTYESGGDYVVTMTVEDGCELKLGNGTEATGILGTTALTQNTYRTVLKAVEVGSGVDALRAYCFQRCSSLEKIMISPDVTTVGASTFAGLYAMGSMHFYGTTPPSISNSQFSNLPVWCKIYVPEGYLTTYQNKTNYPSKTTYTYVEE